ncbi:MAG: hypothetical protein ACJAQX_002559 [Polaribacter sp.]|jgi:hypothetical protein
MLKKEIKAKIKLDEFTELLNTGKFKIELNDLQLIKRQAEIKPIFKDSIISVSKESINNSLKSTLNNHLLIFQVC